MDDHLEHRIATSMRENDVPGISLALIEDGAVAYTHQFGTTRTTGTPLDAHALFQVASLSKPVFAYAVLALAEHGVIDLHTPLSRLAPDPAIVGSVARSVTARHVLTHTTGFPNWREDDGSTTLDLHEPPGTRFGYSGEGFEYLQRVLEHVTGLPLEVILRQQVLGPLAMSDSRWDWARDSADADLVDADGIALIPVDRSVASAAWSLLTTAADYARFLQAMLDPRPATPGHLAPATVQAMLTPAVQVGAHAALWWGIGWGVQQTTAGSAFYHWGGPQNDYASYTVALPAQRRAVVILTNGDDGLRACRTIAEHALGVVQPAFDWLLPEDRWTPAG